jgi:hypothetical protein
VALATLPSGVAAGAVVAAAPSDAVGVGLVSPEPHARTDRAAIRRTAGYGRRIAHPSPGR